MSTSHPDKPTRRRYPSDLSERSWGRVSPAIPADHRRGRKRSTSVREVVNGINYRWTTGCTWRMLPHDFPPWETVYSYFRRWMRDGTLRKLRDLLIRREPTSHETAASRPITAVSPPDDLPGELRQDAESAHGTSPGECAVPASQHAADGLRAA